jgi:RHS repeat-associated protein
MVAVPVDLATGAVSTSAAGATVSFSLRGTGNGPGATPGLPTSPTGPAAVSQVAGSQARYDNVARGVSFVYEVLPDGVKETVTLADRAAASSFVFDLEVPAGARPVAQADGSIVFADEAGTPVFQLATPWMRDASGAESYAVSQAVVQTETGFELTLTADRTWLDDPERVWPVQIDPTLLWYDATLAAAGYCKLSANTPNTSLCTSTLLAVGQHATNGVFNTALRFNVSSIPSYAEVLDAELQLHTQATAVTMSVGAHELTQAFTQSATWNKRDGTNNWTTAGGTYTATAAWTNATVNSSEPDGWESWHLAPLVRGWVTGATTNNGILLRATTLTSGQYLEFASPTHGTTADRPRLLVRWQFHVGSQRWQTFETFPIDDMSSLNVDMNSGNVVLSASDLFIAGTEVDLAITRSYNSRTDMDGLPGERWASSTGADVGLSFMTDSAGVILHGPTGAVVPFDQNQTTGALTAPSWFRGDLVKQGSGAYWLTWWDGRQRWEFSSAGVLTRIAGSNSYGNTSNDVTFAYNGNGTIASITDTQERVTTFTHLTSGCSYALTCTVITDPTSRTVRYERDAAGNLTGVRDLEGNWTYYQYGGDSKLERITDGRGNQIRLTYAVGASTPVTINYVSDPGTGAGDVYTLAYDFPNRTHTVTDPRSNTTTYIGDAQGRVLTVRDDDGNDAVSGYTSDYNVQTYTDRMTGIRTLMWTGGNMTSSQSPTGATTTLTYNAVGSNPHYPATVDDELGNTTTFTYDANGNVDLIDNDLAADDDRSFTQTSVGNTDVVTDAMGNVTDYGYDAQGNLTSVNNAAPLGDVTITVDSLSRTDTVTDGRGVVWDYGYDAMDRITSVTVTGGPNYTYTYDANGNRTQATTSTLGATDIAFDRRNRITEVKIRNSGGTVLSEMDYTYDSVGNLLTLAENNGTPAEYTYNNLNLADSFDDSVYTTTFSYDDNYRREYINYPNNITEFTDYDTAGRVLERKAYNNSTPGTNITRFAYTYTQGGNDRYLRQTMASTVNGTTENWTYSYDALNRIDIVNNTGTAGNDFNYDFDGNSNRTQVTTPSTTTYYRYAGANQLCFQATVATGSCGAPPGGAITFTYDGNGNLTGSSNGISGTYNNLNQTTSYTPAGGSALSQSYRDVGQGFRYSAGTMTETQTLLGLGHEYNGSTINSYYGWTPDGMILEQIDSVTSGFYFYLHDGLGSVAAMTNTSGTVVRTYRYDPYGNITATTGTTYNPITYAAGHTDPTGLIKFGERYYNPTLGRWTQMDPSGQDPNPYTYTSGDPVNRVDPSGLYDLDCDFISWNPGCTLKFSSGETHAIADVAARGGSAGAFASGLLGFTPGAVILGLTAAQGQVVMLLNTYFNQCLDIDISSASGLEAIATGGINGPIGLHTC